MYFTTIAGYSGVKSVLCDKDGKPFDELKDKWESLLSWDDVDGNYYAKTIDIYGRTAEQEPHKTAYDYMVERKKEMYPG